MPFMPFEILHKLDCVCILIDKIITNMNNLLKKLLLNMTLPQALKTQIQLNPTNMITSYNYLKHAIKGMRLF